MSLGPVCRHLGRLPQVLALGLHLEPLSVPDLADVSLLSRQLQFDVKNFFVLSLALRSSRRHDTRHNDTQHIKNMQPGERLSTFDRVLASLDQKLFIFKILFTYVTKQATLLSLPFSQHATLSITNKNLTQRYIFLIALANKIS